MAIDLMISNQCLFDVDFIIISLRYTKKIVFLNIKKFSDLSELFVYLDKFLDT